MVSLEQLQSAIEASWAADTSYTESEWSVDSPARGHCVVTSLVVQHFFGGDLRKVTTVFNGRPESHYYNVLPSGATADFTRQQYPHEQSLTDSDVNLHGYATVRDKMLDEPGTKARYELLLERVEQNLHL